MMNTSGQSPTDNFREEIQQLIEELKEDSEKEVKKIESRYNQKV